MTTAIARRRILTERDLRRREHRLFGRRAARPRREQVLQATNDVGVLLSLLAAEDESDS
jgi:hypothetical protein